MRVRVTIDDKLLQDAQRLTGIHDPRELVAMGLQALVRRAAAVRLGALGGTEIGLRRARRRRAPAR